MAFLKANYPVFLAALMAILAGVTVWVVIQSQAPSVPVVVALERLAVGEVITDKQVEVRSYPASMVGANTFGDVQEVVGLTITDGPVIQGAMVYRENLAEGGSLQALIGTYAPVSHNPRPEEYLSPGRWVAVEVPAELAMKGLKKGDFVDIYGEVPRADGVFVQAIVSHALIMELPSKDYPRYIVAVEEDQAGAAAGITVHKKLVAVVLPAAQPMVKASAGPDTVTPDENGLAAVPANPATAASGPVDPALAQ